MEPSGEPSSRRAAPQRQPRKRDPLFDAVVEACEINPSELTKSARGSLNKALADLRGADARSEDVPARAARHKRKWPEITLTATSLAKHWPELGAPVRRRQPAAPKPTEHDDAPDADASTAIAGIRAQLGPSGRQS